MSQATGIEWTDATWNPIRGCSRVSEGCRNCYAEKVAYRFSGPGQPYEGLVRIGADGKRRAEWSGKIRFAEEHLLDPLKWRNPRRIFVNSMSDLFHENVTDEQLDRIFAVMALCPQHTFQVLTKRPDRMRQYLSVPSRLESVMRAAGAHYAAMCAEGSAFDVKALVRILERVNGFARNDFGTVVIEIKNPRFPLPNVWLGVSVENQKAADERIPLLLQTPAAVRFLSCEPLLGPITFRPRCDSLEDKLHAMEHMYASKPMELIGIDWVIAGGESGLGARPMHPDWARGLRDQCQSAGVAFFFKQWGEFDTFATTSPAAAEGEDIGPKHLPGRFIVGHYDEAIKSRWVYKRVGKKAAGRLLDGREWNEFPAARVGGGDA